MSFEKFGLNDLAWKKEDAINLIKSLLKDKIGILGGDVYLINPSNHLEFLYDNWACERVEDESNNDFYSKSKLESLKYIEKYPVGKNENIFFSITFTEQICL